MPSLAHHFMALISQICAKGFITETERDLVYILGENKLQWSKEQVENLLVIQLHPDSFQEYTIEETLKTIDESGAGLGMELVEVDAIKKIVAEDFIKVNQSEPKKVIVVGDELITRIKGYKNMVGPLKTLTWFVDQKWHSLIKDFTPVVRKMFGDCLEVDIQLSTFENLIDHYFVPRNYDISHYGVGTGKLDQVLNELATVVAYAEDLINCESEIETAIILFEIKSVEDKKWLQIYFNRYQKLPYFWLFRHFILSSLKERDGQIIIHALSNSPLKNSDIAEAYPITIKRVDQLLNKIEEALDSVLAGYTGILNRCNKLNELKAASETYLIDSSHSLKEINTTESCDFTIEFLKTFVAKLLKEEYFLIATPKVLIKHLLIKPLHQKTGHRWQNTYVVPNSIQKDSIYKVVEYLDGLCASHFKEDVLVAKNIQPFLTENILDLINEEGKSWQVKRIVDGKHYHNFTKTFFKIEDDFKITWLEKVENITERETRILRRMFYELELKPMTGVEIEIQYQLLDQTYKFSRQNIHNYSEILAITNIANQWMSIEYALKHFHPDILNIKKPDFRDAMYYYLIKNENMKAKTRSEWAKLLNELFNHNYTSANLSAVGRDERFKLNDTVLNGIRTQLIFLSLDKNLKVDKQ